MGAIIECSLLIDYPVLNKLLSYSMIRLFSNTSYSILLGLAKSMKRKLQLLYVLTGPKDLFPSKIENEELIEWSKEIVKKNFHVEFF